MHKAAEKKRKGLKELEGRRRTELPLVFMWAAPRFWELGFDAARLCRRLCCGINGRRVRKKNQAGFIFKSNLSVTGCPQVDSAKSTPPDLVFGSLVVFLMVAV